jgi:DDE superfamily endonuclease
VIPPEQDAAFVCAMENVLAVYERPYDERFPVVCLDEQPKQLIAETRQTHQCSDGTVLVDYEYERKGTASIFMSFEPLGGKRFITVHDQHTHKEWASVVADLVENRYAGAEKITLVGDNLSTHKLASLYKAFPAERARAIVKKLEMVYTPKHGSWLNMAECELSVLTRVGIADRVADKETLCNQCSAFEQRRNETANKADWQFTTSDARIKLKRLYPIFNT